MMTELNLGDRKEMTVNWFRTLTGVDEQSAQQVRRDLKIAGDCLACPNGNRPAFGHLETPQLSELRQIVNDLQVKPAQSTICEVVGDVRALHCDPQNAHALFQVASQFNLLEMTSPSVTPERGVGIYESDPTQGPACAIACGAGTIYRNYFTSLAGGTGQTARDQIDCSCDLGQRLGNIDGRLWSMNNGYLFPTDDGINEIATALQMETVEGLQELSGELRIGLQWNCSVTLPGSDHKVSQAYCSALPVAYGRQPTDQWRDFAGLVLHAAYEATLCAAVINAAQTGVNQVYLTLLGGGVFGNRESWIMDAIASAFQKHRQNGLDVQIVSYGRSKRCVTEMIARMNG